MTTTRAYCACNPSEGDIYDRAYCGPIRASLEDAAQDRRQHDYDSVRYVHTDGYLYVDPPSEAGED